MHAKSWAGALWQGKCPRCRKGQIFKTPAFNLRHFASMHSHCPVCGVSLEPEPGFYYGAMFVSYAFTVAIFTAIALAIYLLIEDASETTYIAAVVAGTILSVPWSFRYSRICFLYLFGGIKHDPSQG